ncbi:CopD family protein [Caballeronia hypogeia]|uniref:CopD family protein n=1 Tax=Caballeronia hypogeia TaxID=1777140 RepID=UPI0012FD5E1A|nr:CopD family protein [Caballeronia hypogeia]
MYRLVIAQIVLAAVQDVLAAVAAGALACAIMTMRCGLLGWERLRALRTASSTVLVFSALVYLWLQAAIMSGSPLADAGSAITTVVTQSHFDRAWSLGFAGALPATLSGQRKESGSALFALGLMLWVAAKAATSYAADSGDFSWREAIHVVHLFATAFWAGSVIVDAILLTGMLRVASGGARQRAAFCSALSHLATSALVIVLVTGLYSVLQDGPHVGAAVLQMMYGRVLAGKLACVALAILLGGWNRAVVLPNLRTCAEQNGPGCLAHQRRFDVALAVEAVAMLAVLSLAALLGHTAPTVGSSRSISVFPMPNDRAPHHFSTALPG